MTLSAARRDVINRGALEVVVVAGEVDPITAHNVRIRCTAAGNRVDRLALSLTADDI